MSTPMVSASTRAAAADGAASVSRAYLYVIAATFLWSGNVIAVKLILREFPALVSGLMRVILTGTVLAAMTAGSGKTFPSRRQWSDFLSLGIVGVAWSFVFYTLSYAYTSVGHAVFIGALTPIAVLVLAVVQKQERVSPGKLFGMIVSLAGVLLLGFEKSTPGGPNWGGDLLAFAGMWCFAYYTLRSKRLASRYDSALLNTAGFLVGAAFCLPLLIWRAPAVPWSAVSWVGWLALAYSATAGSAAPYLAYAAALRRLTASQAAAFQYVQPIISTFFGVWLLREGWGAQFAEGAALILLGVFLAERRSEA